MTALAPVVDRIRQEYAAADQAGRPRPGRPTLVRLTNSTDYQVRRALETIDRHTAASPTPVAGMAAGPVVNEPEPEPATVQAGDSAGEVTASLDDNPPIRRGWLALLALPAFVAVWGGWVGLGALAGFGPVRLLPGIADNFTVNLAVTLPAGMEVYAVIGLRVWLSSRTRTERTRRFAAWSSCAALLVGCSGQVAYHVLARPATGAPLGVTVAVACLPVALLGMGAALFHLVADDQRHVGESAKS